MNLPKLNYIINVEETVKTIGTEINFVTKTNLIVIQWRLFFILFYFY